MRLVSAAHAARSTIAVTQHQAQLQTFQLFPCRYLADFKADLTLQCQLLLESGLESQNGAQMTIALQSFHNMAILREQILVLLEKFAGKGSAAIREALDMHRLAARSI